MKATSYELRQKALRADHCDTLSTVTGEMAIKLSQRFSSQPLLAVCFDLRRGCYES
jgi:hypothetical protein